MRSARSRPARDAKLQAKGALRLDAGRLTLAGLAETNAGMTLASGTDLRVDGSAMARALSLTAGQGLTLGATGNLQASGLLQARPAASCRPTARSRASRISACRPMPTPW